MEIALVVTLYWCWRRIAKHPSTLIIDQQGLNFEAGCLPWADIERVWAASDYIVRVETGGQTAQGFYDREHAKPHWSSAIFVAIERIWAGINSIPINVAHFEASAEEVAAAIERARPRKANT